MEFKIRCLIKNGYTYDFTKANLSNGYNNAQEFYDNNNLRQNN